VDKEVARGRGEQWRGGEERVMERRWKRGGGRGGGEEGGWRGGDGGGETKGEVRGEEEVVKTEEGRGGEVAKRVVERRGGR
jgi:hypothetical protein